jgi:hypothetical protein
MNQSNTMFTITADHDDAEGPLTLLFANMGPMFTQESLEQQIQEIANSELIQTVIGPNALITPFSIDGHLRILATNNIRRWAIPALADSNPILPDTMVFIIEGEVQTISRRKTYTNCTLPQQIIMGCLSCKDIAPTKNDCIVKTLSNHDYEFKNVEANSLERRKSVRERTRRKRFKTEVCSHCAVASGCPELRYCNGPFPETEALMVKDCLEKFRGYGKGFTKQQLLELLYNSGELTARRPNNRRCWATLWRRPHEKILQFRLNSVTRHAKNIDFETNFHEAKAFLQEYDHWRDLPNSIYPLTDFERAMLFELTSIYSSPTHKGRWRSTVYDTVGFSFNPYRASGRLNLHFTTRGSRDWANDGYICPWTINPHSYTGLWADITSIKHSYRNDHPLSCYNFHGQK